jgi:predicted Zn-dependent peptidase
MADADLTPQAFSMERLQWLHRRIVCPGNLVLGVTGDVSWEEIEPRLIRLLADWPACAEPLPPIPIPRIREEGGVFLIPRELEQSTVVLAHSSQVRQADTRDFFSSRIGNSVLGASGFSSRLLSRVRTERGYAYGASSLWTTPRLSPGLVGAITQTKSGTTIAATRLILDIVGEMTRAAPTADEVRTTVDEIVNGFVFNFESAAQIVSRQMIYRSEELPADWLERYLAGIQAVTPQEVLDVFRKEVHPERMTILVVGNPATFDAPLETLGPVTILTP